jgi:hypothetical protein
MTLPGEKIVLTRTQMRVYCCPAERQEVNSASTVKFKK